MKVKTLLAGLFFSVQAIGAGQQPAAPTELCVDANCVQTPQPAVGAIKWHPGHYVLPFIGELHETTMTKRIPEVCAESALKGLQIRVDWYDLESSEGTYTFSKIDEIYNALAACKKRLVLEVWVATFNETTNPKGIVPDYLLSDPKYNGGVAANRHGFIARIWEPAVMGRFMALDAALAARFDDAPYFEGFIVTETATGFAEGAFPSTYTAAAFIGQLKRLVASSAENWQRTNVIVYSNFIQNSTQSAFVDFVRFVNSNGQGIGGPDTLPPPDNGTQAERAYRGELDGNDLRGVMPAMWSVQASQFSGKQGTWTPKELHAHCVGTNRCSHMFWLRNTAFGGDEQKWDTGILPFLRSGNARTNESCPGSYGGRCTN